MKMQLAARELELENKHIELLQMTKAEAAARASTASALEQVLRVHARMLAKNHMDFGKKYNFAEDLAVLGDPTIHRAIFYSFGMLCPSMALFGVRVGGFRNDR